MIKLFTSYYSYYKAIPDNYLCIAISRFIPIKFKENNYENFLWVNDNFIAPSKELLLNKKAGNIDEQTYKKIYTKELFFNLNKIGYNSFNSWYNDISNFYKITQKEWEALVFLCYETPEKFCHRHIFAKILNYYGIQCEEYSSKFKICSTNTLF